MLGVAGGFLLRILTRLSPTQEDRLPAQSAAPQTDRFDALVRALPLGVVMLDPALRITFANRAAAAIFGFDRSRMKGMHLIAAVPSVELEQRVTAILEGNPSGGALIVQGKRTDRSYAVSVYPLMQQEGTVSGALIVAEDHTEMLALERARQNFLSNVSHELRTPLSSIKLMLETVNEATDLEARDLFVPQALREVDRLADLVAQLLDQARLQSGRMVLDIHEIDLDEVARPIVSSFTQQAAAADVSLDVQTVRPAIVEADPQRLSQVLVNLIDNALRYTGAGGTVRVEIDVEGGYGIIRVSDTGIGIPYKDLPYVFERFYVVDRARTRGAGGAGLGLAIVKEIVEAHHGRVQVESMLGSGTQFTVKIPVVSLPQAGT